MSTTPVPGTYAIDPSHSEFGFTVRHAGISKVRGRLTDISGEIVVAEPFADSRVEAKVQSASVDTGDENRDNHLRSADFWDAESKPTWTFVSTGIEGEGEEFVLNGDITINGVTKPVSFDVEFNGNSADGSLVAFSAASQISRKDFGLTWNVAMEAGGFLVGDKIQIALEIEAARPADS